MSFENVEDVYVLSPMQHGMLFHTLYAPHSEEYTIQAGWALDGALTVPLFLQSWQHVVDQLPILRTSFAWENLEKPLQIVQRRVEIQWEQYDWRDIPADEQHSRWENFLANDRIRGFALDSVPLMRLTLFHLAENTYRFLWSYHHLLLDGWSYPQVLKEVFATYNALCQGQRPSSVERRPYRDYIAWLQEQDLSQAEAFWRQTLKGFITPTKLAVDQLLGDGSTQQERRFAQQELTISEETTTALQTFARSNRLTLNTLVQSAWALLLSHYSGETDLIYGTVVSGRPVTLAGVESMIGLFVNTLPVRVQVSPETTLLSWLKELQGQQVELRQYEYSPLVQVQGWSDVPRSQPLFESILAFENYPVIDLAQQEQADLTWSPISTFTRTHYPLELTVVPRTTLALHISYDYERFEPDTINRMLRHFQNLLEGMLIQGSKPLAELSVLSPAERRMILQDWNNLSQPNAGFDAPAGICLYYMVESQVDRTPGAPAVVFEGQELTYRQLNERANQLAHYLRRLGVGAESVVGVFMERSLDMVIALLGIWKAGGAYTPLDPALPQERLHFLLEDLKAGTRQQAILLLTQAHLAARLPAQNTHVVYLDTAWQHLSSERCDNPVRNVIPANLAYIIYTSGSTGNPKGVQISHRAVVNFLMSMRQRPGLTADDTLLSITTLSFDIAALELFLPLVVGARLIVASGELLTNGAALAGALERFNVTVMQATPVSWHLLLAAGWQGNPCMRIFCGGEALPLELARQLLSRSASLWNLYGPTETTIWSTVSEIEPGDSIISIGRPIANTELYVLDKQLQPVPIGVPGELYIGGVGVARGYLNRPDLTTERFIPSPFSQVPGERLYRTGDLVRYLPDGAIEYLGRMDYQVKLRGFRIELGEIETILRRHPAVYSVVAMVREDQPGDKSLVAYLVPHLLPGEGPTVSTGDLRAYLQKWLPEYMVPSVFVWLEALPLTPNGKVNRRALPPPEKKQLERQIGYIAPRTPVEQKLADLWAELFQLEQVGVTDNFFELGGHSLIAIRLIGQIQALFQIPLPLRTLFESPTVAGLALGVVEKQLEQRESSEILRLLEVVESFSETTDK